MATQINVPKLKMEIQRQKDQCLYGPIYVWSDSSLSASVSASCSRYCGICQNPNLFKTYSFSASTSPAKIANDMASCLPRVLIVALANLDDQNVENWIRKEFPSYLKKIPFSDIRFINTRGLLKADRDYLESFCVFQNPTVLVFKMGHLIDSFVPPLGITPISDNPSVVEQLSQRNKMLMEDMSKRPPPPSEDDMLLKHDKEKLEWEEKERLKKIEEARKEREAKAKERLRVKARIEEQRRMRQQNH